MPELDTPITEPEVEPETEPVVSESSVDEPEPPVVDTKSADHWKQFSRKNEKAAKQAMRELEEAQKRIKEFEDRDKTEQERLADEAAAAKAEVEKHKNENLRLRVAAEKNLPADLIDRLQGDNLEDLLADADKFLELMKPAEATDFDGGSRATAKAPSRDEIVRLAKEDPVEFNRRVDAGEISAADLA